MLTKKKKTNLKPQKYNEQWITKGIKKSSKRKQKFYEKFLKDKNGKNKKLYKIISVKYKSLKTTQIKYGALWNRSNNKY